MKLATFGSAGLSVRAKESVRTLVVLKVSILWFSWSVLKCHKQTYQHRVYQLLSNWKLPSLVQPVCLWEPKRKCYIDLKASKVSVNQVLTEDWRKRSKRFLLYFIYCSYPFFALNYSSFLKIVNDSLFYCTSPNDIKISENILIEVPSKIVYQNPNIKITGISLVEVSCKTVKNLEFLIIIIR